MTGEDKLTEDLIFEAATEVFLDKGMDGARMQDIADRAGINKSLLHYYYRSKDRLFNAVFEKIAMKAFAKFSPVFDANLTIEEKLRFFFNEYISFFQKNPRLPLFVLNEINRNPARIRKFISKSNVENLWTTLFSQNSEELKRYNITRESFPQLVTSIVAISLFPFAARGVLLAVFEKMDVDFDKYIEKRKTYAADFVISALKNMKQ